MFFPHSRKPVPARRVSICSANVIEKFQIFISPLFILHMANQSKLLGASASTSKTAQKSKKKNLSTAQPNAKAKKKQQELSESEEPAQSGPSAAAQVSSAAARKRLRVDTDSESETPSQKNIQVTVEDVPDDEDLQDGIETEEEQLSTCHIFYTEKIFITSTERLSKKWTSPIYAFYKPIPRIETVEGRRCHVFECAGKTCKYSCRRYLDKGDANSTGNLRKHVKGCWGEEALRSAEAIGNVDEARDKVVNSLNRSGSITASFERAGKGTITYSNRQHTKTETRTEIVRWVSENLRPFRIVRDRAFQCLMKTGRPGYYIPSPSTVSRDVKVVFAKTRKRIAKLLQVLINHSLKMRY
jgi:hypothetical protein